MKIGEHSIGQAHPVFVIAEIGSNHAGTLDLALALVDAAALAGADAAKFQYFRVDRFLVPRSDPEALRRYEVPDDWLPLLRDRCSEWGIEFLCTGFDPVSLDVVDPFVPAHKIGSHELIPEYVPVVVAKGKPIIASLGRHPWPLRTRFHDDLVLLICKSEYPAGIDGYLRSAPEANALPPWGVSDHTLDPIAVPCAAVALGACVVEKHFGGIDQEETPDTPVSLNEYEFRRMVQAIRNTEKVLGR